MVLNKTALIFVFAVLLATTTLIAFAAEEVTIDSEKTAAIPAETVSSGTESQMPLQSDTQWVWGEVVSLDSAAKTISLKYLDYETDQEKEIVLSVDENTAFDNIKGFEELKAKDTLSIDYVVAPDGKNIAKNIGLENPEPSAVASGQSAGEIKKSDTQTAAEQPAVSPEPAIEEQPVAAQAPGSAAQE